MVEARARRVGDGQRRVGAHREEVAEQDAHVKEVEKGGLLLLLGGDLKLVGAEHDDVDAMLDELTDRVSGPRLVPARGPSAVSRAASEVGR